MTHPGEQEAAAEGGATLAGPNIEEYRRFMVGSMRANRGSCFAISLTHRLVPFAPRRPHYFT